MFVIYRQRFIYLNLRIKKIKMKENTSSLIGLLNVLIRWKKPIAALTTISVIAAIAVSLLMNDEFESVAVFYPVNPAMTDRQMLFNEKGTDQYIDYFGSKNDINRMISIAYSASVIDFLLNEYNLHERYRIDTTEKLWQYKTRTELLSKYSVKKSELGAIEVTIVDEDRLLAAEMANKVVELVDKLSKEIIMRNKMKVLDIYKAKYDEKESEVHTMADSLSVMRIKYAIEELESPDGQIVMVKGNNVQMVEVFKILLRRHMNAIKDLNVITTIYEQHLATLKDDVSAVYIVEQAYPAEKKVKPMRSLIVLSAFFIALFVGIAGALIAERIVEIKQQLD
jgi:LPS O-antigen subunit length determinant protein (WzzB/FepE family)